MGFPYYPGQQQNGGQPMGTPVVYGYQQQPQGQLEQLRAAQAAQAYQAAQQQAQAQAQAQQAGTGIQWVQGEAGAKAYWVAPGASVMLMDSEEPRFYIKSADGAGMPMPLRIFDYTERQQAQQPVMPTAQQAAQAAPQPVQQAPAENYATWAELAAVLQRLEEIERQAPAQVPEVTPTVEPEKTEKGGPQHGKRSVSAAQ